MSPAPLQPSQILAVGRNYAAHAEEMGDATARPAAPLLFWKPVGCLIDDGVCRLPRWAEGPTRIDYEGEVALVLGRELGPRTAPLPDDPWEAVSGVACAVDVSDRTLQKLEPQWVRAKGFAGACLLGPEVARPADPADLNLRTWHNEALVQEGHTSQLLFPFRGLLAYVHGFLRLFPGDVILTGTPSGVGPVAPGDALRVEVARGRGEATEPLTRLELRFEEGPQVPAF